jgi:ABC-type glutathione transport system ATPase component
LATISLESVSKVYRNGTKAVRELDLEVGEGEFMVLVGPSGCGKTTALRMVAGLEDITSGTMRIGDRVVNGVSPKDRDVAMVFQNYALYPHMTVKENIGFALKLRKVQRREAKQRVLDAAGRPHEDHELSFAHLEVEVLHRLRSVAVHLGYAFETDGRHCSGSFCFVKAGVRRVSQRRLQPSGPGRGDAARGAA